jgi:hypothetical protein
VAATQAIRLKVEEIIAIANKGEISNWAG